MHGRLANILLSADQEVGQVRFSVQLNTKRSQLERLISKVLFVHFRAGLAWETNTVSI